MSKLLAATAAVALWLASPAMARTDNGPSVTKFCGDRYCGQVQASRTVTKHYKVKKTVHKARKIARVYKVKIKRHVERTRHRIITAREVQILPHPPGCPPVLFCGCGVALHIFGKPVRELWLAANWLRFPAAQPAPGMVAARKGHVMAILRPFADGTAIVYDPNSGRRLTRIHRRSLAGYHIVNPHG